MICSGDVVWFSAGGGAGGGVGTGALGSGGATNPGACFTVGGVLKNFMKDESVNYIKHTKLSERQKQDPYLCCAYTSEYHQEKDIKLRSVHP